MSVGITPGHHPREAPILTRSFVDGDRSRRPAPELPGLEHRLVDIRPEGRDPVRLHIAQSGSGTPVVLLHGFPQHWYGWRKLIPLLAAEYRLICVDLRGFGWSEMPRAGYDTESLAADVLALLDALELRRAKLVGHDLGAQVGFRVCLRAPARVSHHLALNTVHPWPQRWRMLLHGWRFWYTAFLEYPVVGALVLRHWPAFTRFLLRRGVGHGHHWKRADLTEFAAAASDSAHAGQQIFWQYVLHDIPALLRKAHHEIRLEVPTLLLAGSADRVIAAGLLAGAEQHADQLEVRMISNAGHYLHEERPQLVADAARELFATEGPARGDSRALAHSKGT